jgi:ribose 5-phosphate isomerase B
VYDWRSWDWLDNLALLLYENGMKISLGSDHAGFRYKEKIKELVIGLGHEVKDFGTTSEEPVDYPKFIRPAAEAVASGVCDRGIVLGGSGNGEAMVANKVRGVRCALCWNEETARLSRQHNDANVLSLGQRMIPEDLALRIVRVWLTTDFEGGRHIARISQIELQGLCSGEASTAPAKR